MTREDARIGTSATSLPSGEGRGGVRRASAVLHSQQVVQPASDQVGERWGPPEATASIAAARGLRKRLTRQEAKLWLRLRALREQGLHFRRQVPIGAFIVDFACLEAGVIVEVDGGQHTRDAHALRDRARQAVLAAKSFRVLRFWNDEVDGDPDAVTEAVIAACAEQQARSHCRDAASRHTPPQPSPEGRESILRKGEP